MKIADMCETVHGELPEIGRPCFLLRLSGCNLRCAYCDTDFTQTTELTVPEVKQRILDSELRSVLITGGEPLLQQKEVFELLKSLPMNIYSIIETNGTIVMDPRPDAFLTLVADAKPFACNEEALKTLWPGDYIKVVFWDRESFEFGVNLIKKLNHFIPSVNWVFSPIIPWVIEEEALENYVNDVVLLAKHNYPYSSIKFQIQIHKYLKIK